MPENYREFDFLTRHSKKPKGQDAESERYDGISESGAELARERAKTELSGLVDSTEPGSVIFISAASNMERTASTGEVYGDALKELYSSRPDGYQVISRDDIWKISEEEGGFTKTAQRIAEMAKSSPEKKVVIDFPMFLGEFSGTKHNWFDKNGRFTDATDEILKRAENNENKAVRIWFETEGNIGSAGAAKPIDVAKDYQQGLMRLRAFARKFIGDRPLVIGGSAHSWDLDAYVTYLGNEGKVTPEGFDKVCGGDIVKETELVKIDIGGEQPKVYYRGKEFAIKA